MASVEMEEMNAHYTESENFRIWNAAMHKAKGDERIALSIIMNAAHDELVGTHDIAPSGKIRPRKHRRAA